LDASFAFWKLLIGTGLLIMGDGVRSMVVCVNTDADKHLRFNQLDFVNQKSSAGLDKRKMILEWQYKSAVKRGK
jgi:hypothetical protein